MEWPGPRIFRAWVEAVPKIRKRTKLKWKIKWGNGQKNITHRQNGGDVKISKCRKKNRAAKLSTKWRFWRCAILGDTRELKWHISCAVLGLVVTLARRGDRLVRSRPTTPEDGCVFLFANPEFGDVKIPGTYASYGYIFVTPGRSRPRMVRKIAKFSHFTHIFEVRGYRFYRISSFAPPKITMDIMDNQTNDGRLLAESFLFTPFPKAGMR